MSKFFFRLYIVIVITFVGVGWSLDQVFDRILASNKYEYDKDTYRATSYLLIREILTKPQAQWQAYLDSLQDLFDYPLSIESLSEVASMSEDLILLENGEVISLYNDREETHHQRIGDSQFALTMGPIMLSEDYLKVEFLLAAIFYFCIAIAVLIWLWPLWRSLSILDKAAAAFGRGEFGARAELSSSSMIASLAGTFNSMADRIQRLIDSHKELTSSVSHELRTPIARLRFGMEMLNVNTGEDSRQRYISGMQSDIDELDMLVTEMLDYAMFDRDKPNVKMTLQNIVPWLNQIVDEEKIDSGTITLDCQYADELYNVMVQLEPKFMNRAIVNLIRNAVRYAYHKVNVVLNIRDDICFIHVDDDGPGLPESARERVFEPFTRHDTSRDRRSGGYGLGLAIVKQISEWHGGKAGVSSSPIGGARFTIEWPGVSV